MRPRDRVGREGRATVGLQWTETASAALGGSGSPPGPRRVAGVTLHASLCPSLASTDFCFSAYMATVAATMAVRSSFSLQKHSKPKSEPQGPGSIGRGQGSIPGAVSQGQEVESCTWL